MNWVVDWLIGTPRRLGRPGYWIRRTLSGLTLDEELRAKVGAGCR